MTMKFITENIFLIAVAFVSGAMLVWPLVRRGVGVGGPSVNTLEATVLINRQDALVIDVRDQNEYAAGHILNARNVPLAHLEERIGELSKYKEKPVIIACGTGQRSGTAQSLLKKHGFSNVVNLAGGFAAWRQAGLPVEK
jgi:rhodanese-related sulfurtransferase